MADDIKGNVTRVLHPESRATISIYFPAKTSATDQQNVQPYGATLASGTVTAYKIADGSNASGVLNGDITVADYYIYVPVKGNSSYDSGRYGLHAIGYCDDDDPGPQTVIDVYADVIRLEN